MNRRDVLPLLQSVKDDEMYYEVREILRQLETVELFHGLYPIAIRPQYEDINIPSYCAGNMLFDLNPPCQIGCLEAISALLDGWNVSLEEVPFYICKQMGLTEVKNAIHRISLKPLTVEQRAQLDTIIWWTNGANEEFLKDFALRRAEDEKAKRE